jgi:uncharacterized RDD family membrane protein YckC
MKCPKCGYLGFERVDRCRNCQYDFSLSSNIPEPDFTIRRETETAGPLDDLSLIDPARAAAQRRTTSTADLDRLFGEAEPARAAGGTSRTAVAEPPSAAKVPAGQAAAPAPREELPLFGPPIPDDEPLITRASPPRPPLAVRRSTPEVPRLRSDSQARTPSFDLALDVSEVAPIAAVLPADRNRPELYQHDDRGLHDAGVGARLFAVVIDLLILAVIDAAVIYFTMQLCALNIEDVGILPKGPLLAFLFVQNGGYLVAFTAGGQTLGKMAAGIRVVQSDSEGTLDLGRAFLRTSMWVVLAVPAGLGFVSALFNRDHRGLHDRFAGTRVVRASA